MMLFITFFSVNGVPQPPEHTLVAEFRRELTQIRDRINYLLNRLEISDESDKPKGGQQQAVDKQTVKGSWFNVSQYFIEGNKINRP